MSRVAPRVGVFAGALSAIMLVSLVFNSWLGIFPAVISGVMPMKFHIHYYIANLLGLEFSAAAYSESGVITLQEKVQLILLPFALITARICLRVRPTFEMPKKASLSEQAEAMEAGTVAKVESEIKSGGIRVLFSRLLFLGLSFLFIFNSMLGIIPGFLFNQNGMKIHPVYALSRLLEMDTTGPTWSDAATLGAQEIILIWIMIFIAPMALSIRAKPMKTEAPTSELPPVGRSNDRVINPLAAEVIASVLGDAQRLDSQAVDSALSEMDKIVDLGRVNPSSGVTAELAETDEKVDQQQESETVEDEEDLEVTTSEEPEFVLESPKEEAKFHLDKEDVHAIEKEIEVGVIPDASTLLGIDIPIESSNVQIDEDPTLTEDTEKETTVLPPEDENNVTVEFDENTEEETQSESGEDDEASTASRASPSITGAMSVRPTSLPATAELDPKTGRWMINGVPVGPKVTATGLDSESSSRRIGGEDPLKESKKSEVETIKNNSERRGEKRGRKIESEEPENPPKKLTKDGQKEHEALPDLPEMAGRPNAERPKERKDDVQLPDMPKF